MPKLYPLMTLKSIVDEFRANVIEAQEPSGERIPSLLIQFRKKLTRIYYSELCNPLNESTLKHDKVRGILVALRIIFSDKFNKYEMLANLEQLMDTQANNYIVDNQHWQKLNQQFAYFEDNQQIFELFRDLAEACRTIIELIEKSNGQGDTAAYLYAYKLMALFNVQEQPTLPDLQWMAKKTDELLKNVPHGVGDRPYHDTLLVSCNIPARTNIRDLNIWLNFINNNKTSTISALKIFANAPIIEKAILDNDMQFPNNVREAKTILAVTSFVRGRENIELATLCRHYNIPENSSECSFNKCLDFLNSVNWPIKNGDNLPQPIVKGEGIAEGYYWVKLPTNDLHALILGVMTNCCQNIGGDSELCVKDAVSLPDNGLYVLLKLKKGNSVDSHLFEEDGSINYQAFEVVAQSYAWISKLGNITLDSFERSIGRVPDEVAHTILLQFATQTMQENDQIKFVNLGIGGGTPSSIKFEPAYISETMRFGYFYGDSRYQLCIAANTNCTINDDTRLNNLLKKYNHKFRQCIKYLNYYLTDEDYTLEKLADFLENNPDLETELDNISMTRLLLATKSPQLRDLVPAEFISLEQDVHEYANDYHSLIETKEQISQFLVEHPELEPSNFHHLSVADLLLLVQPHDENYKEVIKYHSIIQLIWRNASADDILRNFPNLSKEKQQEFLFKKQEFLFKNSIILRGKSPDTLVSFFKSRFDQEFTFTTLQKIAGNKRLLDTYLANKNISLAIINLLTERQFIQIFREEENKGNDILRRLLTKEDQRLDSAEFFSEILDQIYIDKRLKFLKIHYSTSVILSFFVTNSADLRTLLTYLPQEEHANLLQDILNSRFVTLNPDIIVEILKNLSENQLLEALNKTIRFSNPNKTVFELAYQRRDLLIEILNCLPRDQRFELFELQNSYHEKIISLHIADPVISILNTLPVEQRFKAITYSSYGRYNLLQQATEQQPKLLIEILQHLPEEQRLDAVKFSRKFSNDYCVLDRIKNNPDLLLEILDLLPIEQKLQAITVYSRLHYPVIETLVCNPNIFATLLNSLPKEHCLELLHNKHSDGQTILHVAASYSNNLLDILELYPEDERFVEIQKKNYELMTVMHIMANRKQSIRALLELCPNDQRVNVLQETDKYNNILLHSLAEEPNNLIEILDLLSTEQLIEIIETLDQYDKTILDVILLSDDQTALIKILERIPTDQILNIVNNPKIDNEDRLLYKIRNNKIFKEVLALLPANRFNELPTSITQNRFFKRLVTENQPEQQSSDLPRRKI